VKGPGVDLGGDITLSKASPTKVRFDIKGPLLDLGQVMGLLPPSEKKEDTGPMLTPEMRKSVEALDVAGTIAIDKVQRGGLVATNFKSEAALDQGAFLLKNAGADFFAGHLDASGTRVDLSEAEPKWNLKAKLASVDMQKALTSLAGAAPVAGKLTGGLDLNGAGVDWNAIARALTGNGAISLQEGVLTTTDLGEKVLGALSQGLKSLGKGGVASALSGAENGKTTLRELAAQFQVKDGAMALSKPLTFKAPFGQASLGGKIGLGGVLALGGTVNVPKDVLAKVASGIPLPSGLDVPLGLGGTLTQPIVNVNAQEAVSGLAKGAAEQQVNAAKDRALREGRRGAQDLLKGFGIGK
jgi:AsmA protein